MVIGSLQRDVFESTYDPVDTIITKKPAAPEPAKKDLPKSKTKKININILLNMA